MDDRCYRVECLQCGDTFEATRSDATFCSARCRVAYSREPEKMRKFIEHLDVLGRMLDRQARKYYRSKAVFEAMQQLHKSLGASLERFEGD